MEHHFLLEWLQSELGESESKENLFHPNELATEMANPIPQASACRGEKALLFWNQDDGISSF